LKEKLEQLCPTRGPVKGFVRPSLGFSVVKVSYILTTCPILVILNLTNLMQEVLSATLSRLLPLQIRFKRIQYI